MPALEPPDEPELDPLGEPELAPGDVVVSPELEVDSELDEDTHGADWGLMPSSDESEAGRCEPAPEAPLVFPPEEEEDGHFESDVWPEPLSSSEQATRLTARRATRSHSDVERWMIMQFPSGCGRRRRHAAAFEGMTRAPASFAKIDR